MAKMRGVKPEFWTDSKTIRLSTAAKCLLVGSWHYCCDNGHVCADAMELKVRILPLENVDPFDLVDEIVNAGWYERDENGNLSVPNFRSHQGVDKRWVNTCARCPEADPLDVSTPRARRVHAGATASPAVDTEGPRAELKGSEVKGSEVRGERPRTRGSRLPEPFPVTDEMRAWGRENAADVNGPIEHEKFCDYWRAQPGQKGVKVDWIATWRNWMRRAQGDIEKAKPAGGGDHFDDWRLR